MTNTIQTNDSSQTKIAPTHHIEYHLLSRWGLIRLLECNGNKFIVALIR